MDIRIRDIKEEEIITIMGLREGEQRVLEIIGVNKTNRETTTDFREGGIRRTSGDAGNVEIMEEMKGIIVVGQRTHIVIDADSKGI